MTVSCGNNAEQPAQLPVEQPLAETSMQASADPNAKKDPVCEMAYDTSWTDQTVYNGDTLRFCSEGCKMAFEARPDKYLKAK